MTKPIAWMCEMPPKDASYSIRMTTLPEVAEDWPNAVPLVKQRQWQGLTDAELAEFSEAKLGAYDLCLEVEAKLREKNNG